MTTYLIDIVGTCNLRCPSCPTGNYVSRDFINEDKPLGFMSLDKFDAILSKVAEERKGQPTHVLLFNWGEPLLHPKAAEFIERVRAYDNFICAISSNLSLKIDLDRVVQAGPHSLRISLSGFNPETYSRTHRRGDVELVKANMRKLREAMDRHASTMIVDVAYHVYRHNAGDDMESMLQLTQELGFNFRPIWASFYPVEKMMAYFEGKVSDADAETIEMLALKPEELLAAAKAQRSRRCWLQEGQTAINHDGTVQLCCATFDPAITIASDYLQTTPAELSARKRASDVCSKCIAGGYHNMMLYRGADKAGDAANKRIAESGSRYRLVGEPNFMFRLEQISQPDVDLVEAEPTTT